MLRTLFVAGLLLFAGTAHAVDRIGQYQTTLSAKANLTDDGLGYQAGELIALLRFGPAVNVDSHDIEKRSGTIRHVVILDKSAFDDYTVRVHFFDRPLTTSHVDGSAFTLNDGDLDNLIGVANISTWYSQADNSVGQVLNLDMPFILSRNLTEIHAAVIAGTGPQTYDSAGDITVRVTVSQD